MTLCLTPPGSCDVVVLVILPPFLLCTHMLPPRALVDSRGSRYCNTSIGISSEQTWHYYHILHSIMILDTQLTLCPPIHLLPHTSPLDI